MGRGLCSKCRMLRTGVYARSADTRPAGTVNTTMDAVLKENVSLEGWNEAATNAF